MVLERNLSHLQICMYPFLIIILNRQHYKMPQNVNSPGRKIRSESESPWFMKIQIWIQTQVFENPETWISKINNPSDHWTAWKSQLFWRFAFFYVAIYKRTIFLNSFDRINLLTVFQLGKLEYFYGLAFFSCWHIDPFPIIFFDLCHKNLFLT